MSLRALLLFMVLALMALFAVANWNVFIAPTNLSLLFTDIQAPLGLIMLGFTLLLMASFILFIAYLQVSMLMDTRRHTHEMQAQRALADQAEASRITELRNVLEAEALKLAGQAERATAALEARLDRLEQDLRSEIEKTGNTLSAYIGEFEDRWERDKA